MLSRGAYNLNPPLVIEGHHRLSLLDTVTEYQLLYIRFSSKTLSLFQYYMVIISMGL